METRSPESRDLIRRLSELDWDFHGDRSDSPFSDLHFHPGRFVAQIPAALIGSLTAPGDLVLDPFCGAGTTLVEAQRLERASLGIDLNPVSCLVSRAKTLDLPVEEIEQRLLRALNDWTIDRLEARAVRKAAPDVPPTVQLAKWYHAETGDELCRIWNFVSGESEPITRELLQFCFSATLMSCCAETRSWGYICDNVRPIERRYVDADATFRDKVEALGEAYRRRERRRGVLHDATFPKVKIHQGDAALALGEVQSDSVDLIVTSPPYFGVVDYIKSQRLTLEWFGVNPEPLRLSETGARSKRLRQSALEQYTGDMSAVTRELHRVLKPRATLGMVIGESGRREPVLPRMEDILRNAGFTTDLVVRRKIGLRRRQAASLVDELLILASK